MRRASASAQQPSVISFTGGTNFTQFSGNGDTIGWYFLANQNIQVSHLGYWDSTTATPLGQDHPVGIWEVASQTLIGSATVLMNDPLIGEFRYTRLSSPIALTAGVEYVIGAFISTSNPDPYRSTPTEVVWDPAITHTGAANDNVVATGLVFPSVRSGTNRGRYGPNFLIPAPGAMAMLGLSGLAAGRRRR